MTSEEDKSFPVIGIGASAGGLEALEEFFHNMPENTGMAMVVISHTHPQRASMLPEILQRKISMRVVEVQDDTKVQPNVVYLPPSNRDLGLEGDELVLKERQRGTSLPIDTFLKSLALSRGDLAACVILSGTGTDGSQGLRVIKEKGGVAMVQSIESARYEGMPESAVATGMVDFILTPAEMPERLMDYFSHGLRGPAAKIVSERNFPTVLSKVVSIVSNRTGHDFSLYKKSTLVRRIQRRISVTRTRNGQEYLNHLLHNPTEIEALFQDLLIGVTSFFRDPEAFHILGNDVLPKLLNKEDPRQPFRVWIPGCATGEEVYSVVILILECLEAMGSMREIQVFGTDIDRGAIEKAREGAYPQNIAADVSPERLSRFFDQKDSNYRVSKKVRESVVFAVQNVLKDPPFSKLDLLVCRNLLIYLESKAQKKLLPLFHYSLKPGGALFLGSSETIGEFTDLFTPIQGKWNLYRKIDVAPALQPLVEFPTGAKGALPDQDRKSGMSPMDVSETDIARATERLLLERYTPSCVVVNRKGEITFIHGRTGKFLEPAPGRISVNIVDMAREGLRFELASALRKVLNTNKAVFRHGIKVRTNGGYQDTNLILKPLGEPASLKDMIVVLFEEIVPPPQTVAKASTESVDAGNQRIIDLERELGKLQQDHRTAMEELETSNEELKSVNEELQSSNEELQSTNEELESSREELQSLNEELSTVNAELHSKIVELSESYDTITHVLNSTRIAILFLDRQLHVRRFTDEAKKLVNLIDSDIGRPLLHISTNLEQGIEFLSETINKSVSENKSVEREVRTRDGQSYALRIVPYRDTRGQIDGAILTFINLGGIRPPTANGERTEKQ